LGRDGVKKCKQRLMECFFTEHGWKHPKTHQIVPEILSNQKQQIPNGYTTPTNAPV
jgi:hypothetical protein